MRIDQLPDFAKPYKTKGYDVRLVRNRYQRYKISSKRVPGKKYPVLVQEYLGTIDPVKGFIPKQPKTAAAQNSANVNLVEYGLSDFIIRQFESTLLRSVVSSTELLYRGILYYMYGHAYDRFAKLSYLSRQLRPISEPEAPGELKFVIEIAQKIAELMTALLPDESDRDYVVIRLRDLKVSIKEERPRVKYPSDVLKILKKYKIKR